MANDASKAEVVALTKGPLSAAFKAQLDQLIERSVSVVSIGEMQRGGVLGLLRGVRRIDAGLLLVPVQDAAGDWITQALQLLSGLAKSEQRELVYADNRRQKYSRWQLVPIAASLIGASVVNAWKTLACAVQLSMLRRATRINVRVQSWSNLLYVNANLWFGVTAGGSVGHISGVINSFVAKGMQVAFAACGGRLLISPRAEYIPLVPSTRFGAPIELNNYAFHRKAVDDLSALGTRGFSILYQRLSAANFTGVVLSRRWSVALVTEYNGSEAWVAKHWGRPLRLQRLAELAEEVMLRHSQVVVTVSEVLRDELVARGVAPERIVTYPNCIDPSVFDPARYSRENSIRLRARFGIAPDAVVATFVGTFGQWHGADVFARAIRRMVDEASPLLRERRLRFLFVGDGLRMPEVRAAVDGERCREFVTLAGLVPQNEAPAYLAASDILVSPHVPNADGSRFFGSPTKLFEYLAMGKGIVASNLDQIGDVLRNSLDAGELPGGPPARSEGRLAILCRPGSEEELQAAILFLAEREEWRKTLGANARAEALAKYTWDRHVEEIIAGVNRVCSK